MLKLSCARTNCPLGDFNSTGNRKVSTTTRDGVENNDQSIPTNTVLNGSSEPITKERSSSSQRSRSAVHGRRSPSISVSSVDSNSNLSKTRAATPESFETTRPSSSMQVVSYSPDCFYNLIEENSNVKTVKSPCESLTEREILRCLSDAHHSFSKLEDWQARIRSLGVIQAIILTSKNSQFPKNLFSVICNQLKVMQESVGYKLYIYLHSSE